ncbi:hypothetical protein F751_0487 [Auxenochlorella protothecoides]|uniref:Uncharacterized protein n=1 Tax=Auxenochlorella protothecoides TaxID=3075 RepID=A0A087SIA6_AUXPR|nr:hypothetical protein F751_0487 [Auxenochlorella protothecoides]KFM25460.1 hypothetical protein F751_0487 [Auxenochlorella protothecoides]
MVPAHTLILELCQDRAGLLVDPRSPPSSSWKAAGLKLSGLPGWLTMEDVAPLLHAATGMPITERSIAQDVIALKATGMVVSVRVLTAPPPPEANPDFFSSPEWRIVAPMGKLEYVISSKAEGGTGNGALRIDADSIRPWLSPGFVGFCSGVPGKAHPVALLPLWDCDAIRCPDPDAHTQAAPASAHAPRHPLGSALAGALTRAYAALQERAGRKVGIALGEAWRAAFRAAASSGVDTVVLGDSRSRHTLVGLAAGLERAWGPDQGPGFKLWGEDALLDWPGASGAAD